MKSVKLPLLCFSLVCISKLSIAQFSTGSGNITQQSVGNVGIGTSSLLYKLNVNGIISSVVSGRSGYNLYNGGGQSEWFIGQESNTSHNFKIQSLASGIYTNILDIVPSTRNIGIGGLSNPSGKLGVIGGAIRWGNTAETSELNSDQGGSIELGAINSTVGIGAPYIDFHYTGIAQDYNMRIMNTGNNKLGFRNSGGEPLTILNSNIGIGNTNPGAQLQVDHLYNASGQSVYLNQPVGTWGTIPLFNAYRFLQTASLATDGNFKAFHVGAGGVAIGYANTPIYGSNDALYVNGNIGIGTTTPIAPLHISTNGYAAIYLGDNASTGHHITHEPSDNSFNIWSGIFGSGTNRLKIDANGNVGIGTTYIPTGFKLAVNGKIIAEEVNIKLRASWPDYVFAKNYTLRPIKELENYVKQNNHLPEMPDACEIEKNGINTSEIITKLLKQQEELTLYIIEQDKRIEAMENQMNKK